MDKRTAMVIAAALVAAMMVGIVSHEYTLGKPRPVQIVVQNPGGSVGQPQPQEPQEGD
jgi:hypothetical protein